MPISPWSITRSRKSSRCDDSALIEAVLAHLNGDPSHGFGPLFDQVLRPQGWGNARTRRVCVSLRLNPPRRGKHRLHDRIREPLEIPMNANDAWSADFMADALRSGRRFRTPDTRKQSATDFCFGSFPDIR
jgi:putative transposase